MQDFKKLMKWLHGFLQKSFQSIWPTVCRYIRRVLDDALKLLLTTIAAFLLTSLLLYLIRGFWSLYTSTPVGERFSLQFPGEARFLNNLIKEPTLEFSFWATLMALKVCLATAVVCQIFYIASSLYYSRGWIGKTVWAACIAILAANMFRHIVVVDFSVAYVTIIVPVLCILPNSFGLADTALPELGVVFRNPVVNNLSKSLKTTLLKFRR